MNMSISISNVSMNMPKYCKGTVAWDFLPKVILPKVLTGPLVRDLKQFEYRFEFAKIFKFQGSFALWATAAIWLCATGHCGGFGYALRATAADLVIRYGPLRRIWLCATGHCGGSGYSMSHCVKRRCTVKICNDFLAVGYGIGFAYALQTRLCAMGCNADLVMHYEPLHQTNYQSARW